MEIVDAAVYRPILEKLKERYPARVDPSELGADADQPTWKANLAYLLAHGLADAKTLPTRIGMAPIYGPPAITAAGLDFLRKDGGLTRELGTVTVRLDTEQFRALLIDRVSRSSMPEEEKSRVITVLQDLGEEGLKSILVKGLDYVLDEAPQLFAWLRGLAGL